jgi:hypothetical protein
MPDLSLRPGRWHSGRPWLWGVYLGIAVGGAVVLLGAIMRGFQPGLLLVGLVLLIVFGGIALLGELVRRYTPRGPA